jgi:DNA mismatch repair ATPase MutS
VVGLYYFVLGLPRLLSTLRQHDEHAVDGFAADLVRKHFTEPLDEVYTNFTNLVRLVQTAVDLPAAHAHEYKLLSHFSDELGEIADQQEEVRDDIHVLHKKLCKELGMDADTLRLEVDPNGSHRARTPTPTASVHSSH